MDGRKCCIYLPNDRKLELTIQVIPFTIINVQLFPMAYHVIVKMENHIEHIDFQDLDNGIVENERNN